jgi:hypothetical protein
MNVSILILLSLFSLGWPILEPAAVEVPLKHGTATYELKNFRVVVEEQNEDLKEQEGKGGYLLPVRVEDKRTGEVQRTVLMTFVLPVKEMGDDPPELVSWSSHSASGKVFCRTKLSHGTCETWCDEYEVKEASYKKSGAPQRHTVEECDPPY